MNNSPEKRIRPGARFEQVSQATIDYIARAEAEHKIGWIWALIFLFGTATAVFLGIFIAWGMGLMPNISETLLKWFGGLTVGSIVGLIGTLLKKGGS